MVRLFGPEAARPRAEFWQDWASEPDTATDADQHATGEHPATPPSTPVTGPWQDRVLGVASEWSPSFPGYVAGALEAAQQCVAAVLAARGDGEGRAALMR